MQKLNNYHFQLDFGATREMRSYDDYAEGMRRLVVLAIDYTNTMKPIADIAASEKVRCLCKKLFLPGFEIKLVISGNVKRQKTIQ